MAKMVANDNRTYNQRLGWWLFAVYLVLYVGFMMLCAFSPTVMEWRPLGGLNLAILYGFGLIIAAFVLAMLYGVMCRREAAEPEERV
ncbi:DUF485 domain-containing protein [Roseimaritima sediminicola]|uniref:DUF485 domain-containing protein n=1 Tax=Roseimaritima sediminicola TaxID=2662066 RepID=UPI001298346C|nr:DUF485 domain-containing protein [Roseimaritima sediminicola]